MTSKTDSDALREANYLETRYRLKWRDKPEEYWLARLMQEVGELASSLVGDHDDMPEWELSQISSIARNWLKMRAERADQ